MVLRKGKFIENLRQNQNEKSIHVAIIRWQKKPSSTDYRMNILYNNSNISRFGTYLFSYVENFQLYYIRIKFHHTFHIGYTLLAYKVLYLLVQYFQ